MGPMVSRWVVSLSVDVTAGDIDAAGRCRPAAVDRWIGMAVEAYLADCRSLVDDHPGASPVWAVIGDPADPAGLGRVTGVELLATATEVLPSSFVVAVRIWPDAAAEARHLDARCSVRLVDEVTGATLPIDRAFRDKLIALEHAARFTG